MFQAKNWLEKVTSVVVASERGRSRSNKPVAPVEINAESQPPPALHLLSCRSLRASWKYLFRRADRHPA